VRGPTFDTETANLYLMVDPAQIIQGTVFTPAHQISGAVHTLARRAKGIGQEALGGQIRALVITAGQAHFATYIQLAGHADGQQIEFAIQHIAFARADRGADGGVGSLQLVAGKGFPDQRGDHGFGGAVAVDDACGFQHPLHALVGFPGKGFAAQGPGTNIERK